MERNIDYVMNSQELRDGAKELVHCSVEMAQVLLGHVHVEEKTARGGRKAHKLEMRE